MTQCNVLTSILAISAGIMEIGFNPLPAPSAPPNNRDPNRRLKTKAPRYPMKKQPHHNSSYKTEAARRYRNAVRATNAHPDLRPDKYLHSARERRRLAAQAEAFDEALAQTN